MTLSYPRYSYLLNFRRNMGTGHLRMLSFLPGWRHHVLGGHHAFLHDGGFPRLGCVLRPEPQAPAHAPGGGHGGVQGPWTRMEPAPSPRASFPGIEMPGRIRNEAQAALPAAGGGMLAVMLQIVMKRGPRGDGQSLRAAVDCVQEPVRRTGNPDTCIRVRRTRGKNR